MRQRLRLLGTLGLAFRTVTFAFLLLGPVQPRASEIVDLALILAVDVSASMDERELGMQRNGYARAITSPEVIEAVQAAVTGRIAVSYFEWAGTSEHRLVVPWTIIQGAPDAFAIAMLIDKDRPVVFDHPRVRKRFDGGTALGEALAFAGDLLLTAPPALRKTIDVSGDGMNNEGIEPGPVRDRLVQSGVTINGMPILSSLPALTAYYEQNVAGGTLSFVLPAHSFEDFGRAVRAKLTTEVAGKWPTRQFAEVP
jgi:hypothetical protein